MEFKKLSNNFEKAIDALAVKKVGNFDLESADAELLTVTDENLDESVSMQPTGTAYFAACLASAKRNLEEIEFFYDLWRKEKFILAKSLQTGKLTIADLEAKVDMDNKTEVIEWKKKLLEAQQFVDNCESMYDAWNQKSYSLSHHAKMRFENWNSGSGSILIPSKPEQNLSHDEKVKNVRKYFKNEGGN